MSKDQHRPTTRTMLIVDLALSALVVGAAAWLADPASPLRSADARSATDLVGLVMQVGGGMAALVLAPMAIVAGIRTGGRMVMINRMRGHAFARASLWAVAASVSAAALAFFALALGGEQPHHVLALGSIEMMVAGFLSVVRVAREFAIYLKAKANDDLDPLDAPYERV